MSKRPKRSSNDEPTTLDLLMLLSMPVIAALVAAGVWYYGKILGPLAS